MTHHVDDNKIGVNEMINED
ncbi:uncharacterized protein G2W53_038175 [Senna tora]|uniref:Uncharacterized protein n=1 Tax=Senna tora TaxID=362788 RepID=A0A834W6I7_9FABA|nr:uncharacterized protein G2W53_038175 [Senna tora]